MSEREIDELRNEISDAFAWRQFPGNDALALRAPGCRGYEAEQVYLLLRDKDWRELTLDSILSAPELDRNLFMNFMKPEGFVYFLPAFLRLSLDVGEGFGLADPLIYQLTPPREDRGESENPLFSHLVSSLSRAEKRVVARVLDFLAREYERRGFGAEDFLDALDRYWTSFLNA